MGSLLLGIDVGTYSSKGVLVDPDGMVLKSYVTPHEMDIPQPGWAEQDAEKIWWADVVKICRQLLDGRPYSGEDVRGVAVSAIGPCLLPLDKYGNPLRPGILYGVDTRASKEIDELNHQIGEEKLMSFCRMVFTSQAIGPKILWLRKNEPENWKKVAHVTTASSFLIYRLTGEKIMDHHTASHFMPLMDISAHAWTDRYAAGLINIDKLPRLGWSDEKAGEVNAFGARETGLKIGTPVAVGAVDALSEAVSVGATHPGDLMIMYGSTAFFILTQRTPTPDFRMWSVAGAFKGDSAMAAGMSTTGSLTHWFQHELAAELPDDAAYDILFNRAEKIQPGAGGLLLLPYFSGERTPINDIHARGVLAGLTLAHSKYHIFRAILESVAFGIRHNLETFKSIGAEVNQLIAVGGGTKTDTWLQIVSDVCQVEQIVPALTVGASYGDAILAGLACGSLSRADAQQWIKPGRVIHPDLTLRSTYDELFCAYKSLYVQTKEIVHQLGK